MKLSPRPETAGSGSLWATSSRSLPLRRGESSSASLHSYTLRRPAHTRGRPLEGGDPPSVGRGFPCERLPGPSADGTHLRRDGDDEPFPPASNPVYAAEGDAVRTSRQATSRRAPVPRISRLSAYGPGWSCDHACRAGRSACRLSRVGAPRLHPPCGGGRFGRTSVTRRLSAGSGDRGKRLQRIAHVAIRRSRADQRPGPNVGVDAGSIASLGVGLGLRPSAEGPGASGDEAMTRATSRSSRRSISRSDQLWVPSWGVGSELWWRCAPLCDQHPISSAHVPDDG
jgi:hypothetical protein